MLYYRNKQLIYLNKDRLLWALAFGLHIDLNPTLYQSMGLVLSLS